MLSSSVLSKIVSNVATFATRATLAILATLSATVVMLGFVPTAQADENLLGYMKGAETLPAGSFEVYQFITSRTDKGQGKYQAYDSATEIEYGVTDRFTTSAALKMLSLETNGLLIDAYLPRDENFGFRPMGLEAEGKYNFLSPAKDDIGLAGSLSTEYLAIDPHSGQKKDTFSVELNFLLQKYFMEGELIWIANLGTESTYAHRADIADLPADFEWPTIPEMELEFKVGTGVSYRFVPNWYIGAETFLETEYETEVGLERWSTFAGPSLHYGSQAWWATFTWMPQIAGGGEKYPTQVATHLHLVEKTKQEARLKVGFNF